MSTLLLTLSIAFVIVIIAFILLAIGWLVTGKGKICLRSCGRDPTKKQDSGSCGSSKSSCDVCHTPDEDKK